MEKKIYMWPSTWKKPMVSGEEGAVSSNNYYASKAGIEILKQGGNAFDAAVAVSLVLSVVEPHHSGIGGGCFSLLYSIKTKEVIALDARGIAPKNATKDLFIKDGEVQDEWKDLGGQSVAIPGLYKALDKILKEYGTMSLKEVSKAAIDYARNGFRLSFTGSETMLDDSVQRKIKLSNSFEKLYLKPNKSYYKFGEIIYNPELADLIEKIANEGVDIFYNGKIANKIIEEINKRGGVYVKEDLENYQPKFRTPVKTNYRGYEVVSFAPPSGGSTVIEALNILENFDLNNMEHNSAESIHAISEAMKLAFADRSISMGDPDFVNVNVSKIISKEFAKKRFLEINKKEATEFVPDGTIEAKNYPGNTSHFTIMDKYGNAISQTQTVRDWYGSGIVVDGYGFILNNAMSDFSAKEGAITSQGLRYGSANSIEGGKTPLSSMSPTLVFKDNQPFLAIGAAGGPRIITGIIQGVINAIDYNMMPEEIVRVPFITSLTKGQGLELENGISKDTIELLKNKGHKIIYTPTHEVLSCMLNCVMKKDKKYYPCSTERVDGCGSALTKEGAIIFDGIIQK